MLWKKNCRGFFQISLSPLFGQIKSTLYSCLWVFAYKLCHLSKTCSPTYTHPQTHIHLHPTPPFPYPVTSIHDTPRHTTTTTISPSPTKRLPWKPVIYLFIFAPCPKGRWLHEQIGPSIPILSIPISLEEGAASNDIIFPSLPWSSLSVGTRDHFHKNVLGKMHVAHSANMTKPGQLWFSDASKDPLGFKFGGGNS